MFNPPAPPFPLASPLSTTQSLGKARWVKRSALIYLFESLIHQPLQMTLVADDHWIPNPPPSDTTGVWGGSDYHKKHTNQRGTMNSVTGRRRTVEVLTFFFPFWGRGALHVTARNSIHRMMKFDIFRYGLLNLVFFFGGGELQCCYGCKFKMYVVKVAFIKRLLLNWLFAKSRPPYYCCSHDTCALYNDNGGRFTTLNFWSIL